MIEDLWRRHEYAVIAAAAPSMTLAAIAFPLLVRCLLHGAGTYALTRDDRAAVEIFESFADQAEFLKLPPDSRGSVDTWWARMYGSAKWRL